MGRFTVRISKRSDEHWRGLQEAAHGVSYALKRLGHNTDGAFDHSRLIAFGAHVAPQAPMPPDAIIFNSEQVPISLNQAPYDMPAEHEPAWREWWYRYLELMRKHVVWDYSETNIDRLRAHGVERAVWCPLGYYPELTRIEKRKPDIDVLFVGSLNERRRTVLKEMKARGLKVVPLFNVYGAERDAWLARTHIVLNVHFYPNPIWEVFRCSYLLANELCVVSEAGGCDGQLEAIARAATACVPYELLVERCVHLMEPGLVFKLERQEIAARGAALFKSFDQTDYVRKALEAS